MASRKYFRIMQHRRHPAHKGFDELRYWRPDKRWYHPMLCSSVVSFSKVALTQWNQLIFEGKERWDAIFEQRKHFHSKEMLIKTLKKIIKKNDKILFKGSRSMEMDKIIEEVFNI